MPRSCKANQMTTKVQSMHSQHQKRENYQWSPSQALIGQGAAFSKPWPTNHAKRQLQATIRQACANKNKPISQALQETQRCTRKASMLFGWCQSLTLPKGIDNVHFGLKLEFTSIYENFEKFLENGWLSSWRRSIFFAFGSFWRQVDWWKTWEHSLQIEMLRKLREICDNSEFPAIRESQIKMRPGECRILFLSSSRTQFSESLCQQWPANCKCSGHSNAATKKMDDASRSIHGDAECSWLDRRHHLKLGRDRTAPLKRTMRLKAHVKCPDMKAKLYRQQGVP